MLRRLLSKGQNCPITPSYNGDTQPPVYDHVTKFSLNLSLTVLHFYKKKDKYFHVIIVYKNCIGMLFIWSFAILRNSQPESACLLLESLQRFREIGATF